MGNQGNAEHKGIELELSWMPVENFYTGINVGYLDAKITESSAVTTNIEGSVVSFLGRRPFAPNWNANFTLGYSGDIDDALTYGWILDYDYRSDFSGELTSLADQAIRKTVGYGIANLYLKLLPENSPWEFGFWVKNLSDKVYRSRVKADGLMSYMDIFGEPRSIGASVKINW